MVTPNAPAADEVRLHDAVWVPFSVSVTAVPGHVIVRPDGVVLPVRVTLPTKSNLLVRLRETDIPVWPRFRFNVELVAETLKSPT